jgi:hypothetical protein
VADAQVAIALAFGVVFAPASGIAKPLETEAARGRRSPGIAPIDINLGPVTVSEVWPLTP